MAIRDLVAKADVESSPPRSFAMVRLVQKYRDRSKEYMASEHYHGDNTEWGKGFYTEFIRQEVFIYLGEIPNMKDHVVVAGKNGRVYFGFHIDDFEELPEDET